MEDDSHPEFVTHKKKIERQYGNHFKDEEQLRYFSMLPMTDAQRKDAFVLMKKYLSEEKKEPDTAVKLEQINETN